jgi:cobalt-zinc-cadmium efflux system membrane fusion protein
MKFLVTLAALLALAGCGKEAGHAGADHADERAGHAEGGDAHAEEGGHGEGTVELAAAQLQAAGIRVEALKAAAARESVEVPAVVRPNLDRIAHVSPRIPARIAAVHAQLGQQVSAGQVLAVLDSVEVGEAHSAYLQARSELALAQNAYERAERLRAEEIVSEKDHIRARTDYERAKAAFRAAEDRMHLYDVDPNLAPDGKAVSTFPLRSAFAGTVTEKHAIVGELATPETAVFTVADLSVLWVEASLGERDLGRVRQGAVAEVRVAAWSDEAFPGRVTYVGDLLDKETRTVPVRIEVRNADRRLKPEMFATAFIQGTSESMQLTAPADAVVLVDGKSTLFVEVDEPAEKDQAHFEARTVHIGPQRGGRVAVLEGVGEGDRVVVAGAYELKARMLKSKLGAGHAH